MMPATIPVENKTQSLTVLDTLLYNQKLSPERLVLRRGDTLQVNYSNELPATVCTDPLAVSPTGQATPCLPQRFKDLGANVGGMSPVFSNLHTHGLVTPWEFKNEKTVHGDDIFALTNAKTQTLSTTNEICTTLGSTLNFRYPIASDHPIGLDWYHPHPHGVTGFQVEGGLAGLLMVADADAEKVLTQPVYLQLKDMQVSKVKGTNDTLYQFEKFDPEAAKACYAQTVDNLKDRWQFMGDAKGRCNYKDTQPEATTDPTDYAWLFLVNGELFPNIDVPDQAYIRIANNSANATYRLMLVPEAVEKQAEGISTYYTPPFQIVEKDGMTPAPQDLHDTVCSLTMTTSTRLGLGLEFNKLAEGNTVCKLSVNKQIKTIAGANNTQIKATTLRYTVEKVDTASLADSDKAQLNANKTANSYILTQQGINTGEDDWPPVQLATLTLNRKLANADFHAYQEKVLADSAALPKPIARTDVKEPEDACKTTEPGEFSKNGYRHVAFYYGAQGIDPTNPNQMTGEIFGLVSSGEKNSNNTAVSETTINNWRTAYQLQFAQNPIEETTPTGSKLLSYRGTLLDKNDKVLSLLAPHTFGAGGKVDASICTHLADKPEYWRIYNLSQQIHNFHIHQTKFKVVNIQGAACVPKQPSAIKTPVKAFSLVDANTGYLKANLGAEDFKDKLDEQCVKTYAEVFHDVISESQTVALTMSATPTPSAIPRTRMTPPAPPQQGNYGVHDTFPIPPMGYIDVEINFNRSEQVGEYVFHCHILEHEDMGMMGKIVVKSKATPPAKANPPTATQPITPKIALPK
jgi:FtsP/CotA-like multicopper oxidase with cupredoxin domain